MNRVTKQLESSFPRQKLSRFDAISPLSVTCGDIAVGDASRTHGESTIRCVRIRAGGATKNQDKLGAESGRRDGQYVNAINGANGPVARARFPAI